MKKYLLFYIIQRKLHCYYHSPYGYIKIVYSDYTLKRITFDRNDLIQNKLRGNIVQQQTFKQLNEYFSGSRKVFTLDYAYTGTDFERKVRKRVTAIPFGTTTSYLKIALSIGHPHSYRAVANALRKNPLAIIIPCHRVIGSNQELKGYARGVAIKRKLLIHEQEYSA